MTSYPATLAAGLALGGVLALAASWSRGARPGFPPQLGVGATAAVGAAVAARLTVLPWPLALVLVAAVGGLAGFGALLLEQRLADERVPLVADLAVLGGLAGLALLIAPDPDLLLAPSVLGGAWPSQLAAWLGPLVALTGGAAALLLALAPPSLLDLAMRWTAAGALTAVLGAAAAGLFTDASYGASQPLAVALGAAAAAVIGETPRRAAGAGLVLGIAATLLQRAGAPANLVLALVALLLAGLPARATEAAR